MITETNMSWLCLVGVFITRLLFSIRNTIKENPLVNTLNTLCQLARRKNKPLDDYIVINRLKY